MVDQIPAVTPPAPSAWLPAQPGALIGRATDLQRVEERLLRPDVRLLSLVGPAGTGKTRLAVEVAGRVSEHFPDGTWFVDLSAVREGGLVRSAIAEALDVRERGETTLVEALREYLAQRRVLLLLDNFEQVLSAAPQLVELLRTCPELKLLVTSRAALHLRWEHEVALAPLEVPDLARLPAADRLADVPAVALFVQRSQRVDPEFALNEDNARAIAEICVRLDGLPLAIELAAARMRVLPPGALLSRLGRRLVALGSGPLDQPARQRTLGAALDWSYELLSDAEKALFRRFGVFVGGFGLDAIAEVCDPTGGLELDPLTAIESLLEKSLLRQIRPAAGPPREPRFGMLETIRDYALEQLAATGELDVLLARHAQYYLGGADVVVGQISSAGQAAWLRSLDVEHDNLRAALAWCRDAGQPALGLRAAGLLGWFWQVRGHFSEARAWLNELLSVPQSVPPALRAESLRIAAGLALSQSDEADARALFEESLAIRRDLGDPAGLLGALSGLGYTAMRQGDHATAQACFEEALSIQERLDDRLGMAESLNSLANMLHGRGDLAGARALYERSQALNREIGYRVDVVEHNLGVVAQELGDLESARHYFESSVAVRRSIDDTPGQALSLAKLGEVIAAQGDLPAAVRVLAESLVLQRDLGDRSGLAFVLERMALVAAMHGQAERALRLAGASSALRDDLGTSLKRAARSSLDLRLAPARRALRADIADHAWEQGRGMSVDEAIALALEPVSPRADASQRRAPSADSIEGQLTPREREVALLVARGLTNRQIASELVIAERTADVHVSNILSKLGLSSRVQLAAWIVRQGLLET